MIVGRHELGVEPPSPHPGNSNTVGTIYLPRFATTCFFSSLVIWWAGNQLRELIC